MSRELRRAYEALQTEGRLRGMKEAARIRVVREQSRPTSIVQLVEIDAGAVAPRRYYVKTLHATPETRELQLARVRAEFAILQELDKRFAPLGLLGVVRPVALLADDLTLVTEEFPGESLDTIINRLRPWRTGSPRRRVAELLDGVGCWLWHFQEFTTRLGERYDVAELFDYCDDRLRLLVDSPRSGLSPSRARSILGRLAYLGAQVDGIDLEVAGRHNDFRPEHVIVGDDRLVVLDFTGFTRGPRLYDFMKFWMRLEYKASGVFGPSRELAYMHDSFRRGYGRWVDADAPLARLLRGSNLLDTMTDLAEAPPRPGRRLLDRRWYWCLDRQLDSV